MLFYLFFSLYLTWWGACGACFITLLTRWDAHGVRLLLFLTRWDACGACFITFLTRWDAHGVRLLLYLTCHGGLFFGALIRILIAPPIGWMGGASFILLELFYGYFEFFGGGRYYVDAGDEAGFGLRTP